MLGVANQNMAVGEFCPMYGVAYPSQRNEVLALANGILVMAVTMLAANIRMTKIAKALFLAVFIFFSLPFNFSARLCADTLIEGKRL